MKQALFAGVVALSNLISFSASRADIEPVVDTKRADAATADFKFENVATPSPTDAANRAKFTILRGQRDTNGGELNRLHDGRLPSNEDEPDANFFFAAGSEGGRILVDLGEAIEIQKINTYSWHPNTRGPQVYKLYVADSADNDFNPDGRRTRRGDPTEAGWKLAAEVDTRPSEGEPGGQYAVSIADAAGGALGKHRYLLFDISRTESDDPFGNTFFSEIDIIDGKEYPLADADEQSTESGEGTVDVLKVADKYEIAFDTSDLPEIKPWVDETLKPICAAWYPKIVELLPSENYSAPTRFTIIFEKDSRGVAYANRGEIHCAGPWFMRNLEGEAAGAVVHEMVHIVQQYRRARGPNRNPGWMVEGVADYIRWFLYEPEELRPRVDPSRNKYTDSYRITGAFLNYLVEHKDPKLVEKFNAAMREGRYSEDLWKEFTGKTVDDLWADYMQTLGGADSE
ncbi:MAG TPA: basic secretory protein-like protein [Lacipirellulaceae bacterium]|nr:basic secretory protein-like protein [Lacipirellulaceae bacterium]